MDGRRAPAWRGEAFATPDRGNSNSRAGQCFAPPALRPGRRCLGDGSEANAAHIAAERFARWHAACISPAQADEDSESEDTHMATRQPGTADPKTQGPQPTFPEQTQA